MEKRLSGFFIYQAGFLLLIGMLLVSFCFVFVGYAARCKQMRSVLLAALVKSEDAVVIARYRGCELKRRTVSVSISNTDKLISLYEVSNVAS